MSRKLQLERTRGAGAPEVLERETTEEEFRFGEISLLKKWRLRRQKTVIVKQIFCATFFKNRFFLGGPGKRFLVR